MMESGEYDVINDSEAPGITVRLISGIIELSPCTRDLGVSLSFLKQSWDPRSPVTPEVKQSVVRSFHAHPTADAQG